MVAAILAGKKNQTRRIVNPESKTCPYGEAGDTLWVKETFTNDAEQGQPPIWVYRADNPNYPLNSGQKWKPSIFMPKKASRITLEIQEVYIEHLHDLTETDAILEGIEHKDGYYKNYTDTKRPFSGESAAFQSYKTLFESINGPGIWEENPLVWVIKFKIQSIL